MAILDYQRVSAVEPIFGLRRAVLKTANGGLHPMISKVEAQAPVNDLDGKGLGYLLQNLQVFAVQNMNLSSIFLNHTWGISKKSWVGT